MPEVKKYIVRLKTDGSIPQVTFKDKPAERKAKFLSVNDWVADQKNADKIIHRAKTPKSKRSSKSSTSKQPTSAPTAAPTTTAASEDGFIRVELTEDEISQFNPTDILQKEEVTVVRIPEAEFDQVSSAATPVGSADGYPGQITAIDPREPTDRVAGDLSFQATNYPGVGIVAFMLDTGINESPELHGRINRALPSFAGGDTTDSNWHGSHTASIAFGNAHGYSPAVTVVPVQIMLGKNGESSNIIRGIYAAVDLANKMRDQAIARGEPAPIPLMNISLGGVASPEMGAAFKALSDAGFIVTLAAGNDRQESCSKWPGLAKGLPGFVVVQNVDVDGSIVATSNYDTVEDGCINLSAIGINIVATVGTDANGNSLDATMTGTSMSAPAVLGRAAQWVQYLRSKSPTTSRDEVMQAMQEATMQVDSWYTVFEQNVGSARKNIIHRPMLVDPEVVSKRGYGQLEFDAPIGKQAFPLLMRFDKFTDTMADQTVGFSFHLDKPPTSGSLRLALSSKRFISSTEDYLNVKSKEDSPYVIDQSIQLTSLDLDKITKSGDYWVQFKKQYNWQTTAFECFLEVGTGNTPGTSTRLYSKQLPESFIDSDSFGFATTGVGTSPLHLSTIKPFGQFMFLNKVATQTVTRAPTGEPFKKVVTKSPTTKGPTPQPTINQAPKLSKNQCLSFAYDFQDSNSLGLNFGGAKPVKLNLVKSGGKISVSIIEVVTVNKKRKEVTKIVKTFTAPVTATFQIKRDAKTGFTLQLVQAGKTSNIYVYKKGLAAGGVPVEFADREVNTIGEPLFEECLSSAKAGRRLDEVNPPSTVPAYAQHFLASATTVASTALQVTDKKGEDQGMPQSGIIFGVMVVAAAASAAAMVASYVWNKYKEQNDSDGETTTLRPILTEDLNAPEEDFENSPPREDFKIEDLDIESRPAHIKSIRT